MKEVYIISARRTPIGGFLGNLAGLSATRLGSIAIRSAYEELGIDPNNIDAVYMGNVLSAGLGQSPARQASIFAGISDKADCTTINKVCASGMKAAMLGAQQIQLGIDQLVMTGGMESMSNVPHYLPLRRTVKFGDTNNTDGLLKDGLTDVYHQYHMGVAAEKCAATYKISREQQDEYALSSYSKAAEATHNGKFTREIIPVKIKEGEPMVQFDEDIFKLIPGKVSKLKPAFVENGTITAANASNLNDSAAALLLASKYMVDLYDLKPLAKIIAYADAAQSPEWFTTAPSVAITKALHMASLDKKDIDFFEINEAYAAVVLANQQILGLESKKLNPYGGAIAMGHPLGASGARIICTLISVLQQEGGRYGVASICNGGGGASAIVLENLFK